MVLEEQKLIVVTNKTKSSSQKKKKHQKDHVDAGMQARPDDPQKKVSALAAHCLDAIWSPGAEMSLDLVSG